MAITSTPQELPTHLTCAVCKVDLPLARATAGLYDSNNHQAFACVSHFLEVEKLILGWADFITTELEKCLVRGNEPASLLYKNVGSDVWLNP